MLDADKVSLYLIEGKAAGKPVLVSKIFDLHAGTSIFPSCTGDIRVPWGQGVIGYVAETGDTVNLKNAMQVRFCSICIAGILTPRLVLKHTVIIR